MFGVDTYEVTATADFTPERAEQFTAAVRDLRSRLHSNPPFTLHLLRDTPPGRQSFRVVELK